MRSVCLVSGTWRASSASTASTSTSESVTSTDAAFGSCSAWRDEVGGDVHGVGGVVGEDGDLGGARLGVDADQPAEQALGGGEVDVARAGDHVDRLQLGPVGVGAAVGEQRDRLGPARGPHLVDAQQGGGGEDRRVREAAVLGLRRRHQHQRRDARLLRGHDVHHHAGRVDRQPARGVEPDPAHRHEPLGDRAARHDLRGDVDAPLVGVDLAGPLDRGLQRGAHGRVERGQRAVQRLHGHPDAGGTHAVELLRVLQHGLGAPLADGVDDRPDLVQHRVDVHLGARQQPAQAGGTGQRRGAQVETAEHDLQGRAATVRGNGRPGDDNRARPFSAGGRPSRSGRGRAAPARTR